MTRLTDIAPRRGTPFDQALRANRGELLRPRLCAFCLMRWAETAGWRSLPCPFCGCDKDGWLA